MYNYSMKTLISLALSIAIPVASFAQALNIPDNPTTPFDATGKRVFEGSIIVEWRIADDINQACNQTSKDFGNKGFGNQRLQACSFFWEGRCIIITKKKPTMHSVGHEIRHCFYGLWH